MAAHTSVNQRVLCVGLACADLVSVADDYPEEDSDRRVLDQYWQRGGNASNSSTVLRLLGADVECLATLANAPLVRILLDDFAKYGIHIENCVYHENYDVPISVCIINKQNGSRTILHADKSLPELTLANFEKINLPSRKYKWIHFEGRPNVDDMKQMLAHVDAYNQTVPDKDKITTSVEVEKTREDLVELYDKADYVFVSKEHAQSKGYQNHQDAVNDIFTKIRPGATVICAWGVDGAAAKIPDGQTVYSPIFPPPEVIDTLAAGDTFNAATILALSNGESVQDAIMFGCKVAGVKCGMKGFSLLSDWHKHYKSW